MKNKQHSGVENRIVFFAMNEALGGQAETEKKEFGEDHGSDLIKKERAALVEAWKDNQDLIASLQRGGSEPEGTVMFETNVAHAFFLKGKNGEALQMLNRVIEKDRNYELAYTLRAQVLRFLGKNAEARSDANLLIERNKMLETIEKKNRYVTGMEERARTYRAEGKFKEAVADLEAARKVLPEFISVLRELH